jgi:ATP-binding cassette subfamily B protein
MSATDASPIDETVPRFREARVLLWSLLRPFRMTLALLSVVVVVENVARLAVPLVVRRGIDHGIPPIMAGGPAHELMLAISTLCGLVLVQATSRLFFLNRSGRIRLGALLELRHRLFRHFQRLDVDFHDRYTAGRVVSRSTNDVEAIDGMLSMGFDMLVPALLTLLGTAAMLVVLDWRLGLLCLAACPLLVALACWFRSQSSKAYRQMRESTAAVIVQFVETMTGIMAVQAYRRERRNQQIFDDVADRYRETNEKTFKLVAVFLPGVHLVGQLTIGTVLLYGGYRALRGEMTIGTLAAFLLYLRMFFDPMHQLTEFFNTFQSALSALEKLTGVLVHPPGINEPVEPVALPSVRGDIGFDEVTFCYVPDRPIITGLSLTVPAGQRVALVGASGAGKTTIAKLIARFCDPTSGSLMLDGIDLRDLAQADLRRHIVLVTQENFLFSGTVADNIRFGRPEATDTDVADAAAAVGADRFIAGLQYGYHTDVGNRGAKLSAGQRQLIALARAILADPAVLVVDEATSSLDSVLGGRTAVIIAHRLATVQAADRVMVLEDGRVIEDGAPDDLARRPDGRYAALHRAWLQSMV